MKWDRGDLILGLGLVVWGMLWAIGSVGLGYYQGNGISGSYLVYNMVGIPIATLLVASGVFVVYKVGTTQKSSARASIPSKY